MKGETNEGTCTLHADTCNNVLWRLWFSAQVRGGGRVTPRGFAGGRGQGRGGAGGVTYTAEGDANIFSRKRIN